MWAYARNFYFVGVVAASPDSDKAKARRFEDVQCLILNENFSKESSTLTLYEIQKKGM
jgi:hypothetical protein